MPNLAKTKPYLSLIVVFSLSVSLFALIYSPTGLQNEQYYDSKASVDDDGITIDQPDLEELIDDFTYGGNLGGAYVFASYEDKLYILLSEERPAEKDGAELGVYDDGKYKKIADLDEQGINDAVIDYKNKLLYIAGTDPTNGDGWDAGNVYSYDLTQNFPGEVIKHRDPKNGLVNVFHTWGLDVDEDGTLYAAVSSHDGTVTPEEPSCADDEKCYGEIYKSKDGAKTWEKLSTLGGYRAFDVFVYGDDLYAKANDGYHGPASLYKSNDDGKTWKNIDFYNQYENLVPDSRRDRIVRVDDEIVTFAGQHITSSSVKPFKIDSDENAVYHSPPFYSISGEILAQWNMIASDKDREIVYIADGKQNIWRTRDFDNWTQIYTPLDDSEINFISLHYWKNKNWLILGSSNDGKIYKIDLNDVSLIEPEYQIDIVDGYVIAGEPVQFTNTTRNYTGEDIESYEWDFNSDGKIDSNDENPNYKFSSEGIYRITLKVKTANDENSISKQHEVSLYTLDDESALSKSGTRSFGVSHVDVNNDGNVDLFVSNGSSLAREKNSLYLKDKKGNYNEYTSGDIVNQKGFWGGASWADIDADGDLDVYIPGNTYSEKGLLFKNQLSDTKTFGFVKVDSDPTTTFVQSARNATFIDYDLDNDLDLFVTLYGDSGARLFKNDGRGNFSDQTDELNSLLGNSYGISAAWSDYDNDGDPDVFVANYSGQQNVLYQNNGNGTFDTVQSDTVLTSKAQTSSSVLWADFDNDGQLDLFVTNNYDSNGAASNDLFINKGNSNFEPLSGQPIVQEKEYENAACAGDYDNDGDTDIYIVRSTSEYDKSNIMWRNDGNLKFSKVTSGPHVNSNSGKIRKRATTCSFFDYDNDGDLDIYTTNTPGNVAYDDGSNILYTNHLLNDGDNNWIQVKLVGQTPNQLAIGAKVTVVSLTSGKIVKQTQELFDQNGTGIQKGNVVHFGIGDAEKARQIIVEWPSGEVSNRNRVDANKMYTITERRKAGRKTPKTSDFNGIMPDIIDRVPPPGYVN